MFLWGVMYSKMASNNPGLRCVTGKKSGLWSWTRPRNQFWAPLWVLIRPHHMTMCWLSLQHFIVGSNPSNWWMVLSLASLLALSFPCTPECPGTQKQPTVCQVKMYFGIFWHYCASGDVLAAWRAFRATWLSEQVLTFFSCSICLNFMSTG